MFRPYERVFYDDSYFEASGGSIIVFMCCPLPYWNFFCQSAASELLLAYIVYMLLSYTLNFMGVKLVLSSYSSQNVPPSPIVICRNVFGQPTFQDIVSIVYIYIYNLEELCR